ncbi:sensor histidine kinase [Costertonia aggregata]|uniref:Histidine kinase n=1 Tax=Costertonia aggregata TaxID=343403 RepID=A0A7H9APV9_9FLAO|nr:histidine kinase [Costertonia aggregata]QLG45468.1 histidine kinase [Costertonia aggregata]
MFYTKEKRIRYLGFDDFWFKLVGILIISFATYFLFSNLSREYPFIERLISWVISLVFSTIDWLIIRAIMIFLRIKFPSLKDSALRISLLFIGIVFTVIVMDYIGMWILSPLTGDSYNFMMRSKALLSITLISTMTMAIYEAIYFYVRLKKSIREEEQSKQAIVQAQLDALRNQAQPHFFFNTLNTLRDIIDQNSKAEAKEFVDKLSEIYRFLLESGNANLITLRDELKFAKAYIHIQSERFGDNLKLDWRIPNNMLDKMIVPMSLQLLLENAIKHNIISKAKPLTINVFVEDDKLMVRNKIQPKSTKLPSTKVGLKNIQERYRLTSEESVKISNNENQFTVVLPLLNISE